MHEIHKIKGTHATKGKNFHNLSGKLNAKFYLVLIIIFLGQNSLSFGGPFEHKCLKNSSNNGPKLYNLIFLYLNQILTMCI